MLLTIRILALMGRLSTYTLCDDVDSSLDNVRDNGAESIGLECYTGNACALVGIPTTFVLVGPDYIADVIE